MSNDDNKEPVVHEPDSDEEKKEMKESLEIASNVNKEDSIWRQNHKISKALEQLLDITDIIPVFQSPKATLAKQFASTMEGNSKDLIATQAVLRQCCQSVMKVLSFQPASFDDDDQKKRWDLIHEFSGQIRKSIINVMDVGAEWFGFLTVLYHGLAYFYQTMANGHGTLDVAILKFQQAAKEFAEFQVKNADAFQLVRAQSEEAMAKIENTFGGGQAIKNARLKMNEHQKGYAEEIEKLKIMESEKLKEIIPIKVEIAQLKGELAQYDVQLKYANDEISNLDREQRNAVERARSNERSAESAKNYRKELWTRTNWFGWRRHNYYKDVHIGEKDRLQGIADRYRNIRDQAKNEKAAKIEIKKLATKQKEETQQKINVKELKYNNTVKIHNAKINAQVVVVKAAKKRYEDDLKTIEEAVKKYAVGEHSVADFLNSTQQLRQESLKALQATKTIDVNIKRLSQIISSQCETVWTIDTYFRRSEINLAQLIEPFQQNQCITLGDIECDDVKEFTDNIEPFVKDKANYFELKRLKKLCTDKRTISKWKESEKTLGKSNTANLMMQVPALSLFFPSLHRRLKFAWKMLKIADASDNKQILSILPVEIEELQTNDKKKIAVNTLEISEMKAIEYDEKNNEKKKKIKKKKRKSKYESSSEDSEEDSEEDSSSYDSEEERRLRRKEKRRKEKRRKEKKRKKRKKKHKKKKKYESSSNEDSDSSSEESESESEDSNKGIRKKGKKGKKKKKKRKTKKATKEIETDESTSSNENGDSSCDDSKSEEKPKKKKTDKKMMIKTEILTLSKLIDEDTAKCLDDGYGKVIISFDEDKWYKKLQKLLKKGKKQSIDVKLKVSAINTSKRTKYTITAAYLDEE